MFIPAGGASPEIPTLRRAHPPARARPGRPTRRAEITRASPFGGTARRGPGIILPNMASRSGAFRFTCRAELAGFPARVKRQFADSQDLGDDKKVNAPSQAARWHKEGRSPNRPCPWGDNEERFPTTHWLHHGPRLRGVRRLGAHARQFFRIIARAKSRVMRPGGMSDESGGSTRQSASRS